MFMATTPAAGVHNQEPALVLPAAAGSVTISVNNDASPTTNSAGADESRDVESRDATADMAASIRAVALREGAPARRQQHAMRPVTLAAPMAHMDEEDVRRRSASVTEAKEQAYGKLKEELVRAQRELQLKDEECERLERVRCQIEAEVEELTASLFEEANKMVQEANIKRMHTEKLLAEATNKVEVLEAEVTALKTLVITSTPSMPNAHLHPQLNDAAASISSGSSVLGNGLGGSLKIKLSRSESSRLKSDLSPVGPEPEKKGSSFIKNHRRSTSHHAIKVVELPSPEKEAPVKKLRQANPILYEEFVSWRRQPTLESCDSPFLTRALHEDIEPCLGFASQALSEAIIASVHDNQLSIEPIAEAKRTVRTCALTDRQALCSHRIRLAESEAWHDICEHARDRIAAVCDFYTYVRYIKQGLVKSTDEDSYWHMTQLRQQMCNARLSLCG